MGKDKYRKLDVPIKGIVDNIIFSKREVWAYYKISTIPYDFLSQSAKVNLGNSTISALSSLCQSNGKKVDGHVLIANSPFDVISWADQMDEIYKYWNVGEEELDKFDFSEPYKAFMDDQINSLFSRGYRQPVVYLGIKLYTRGGLDFDAVNPLEFGFKDAIEASKKAIASLYQLKTEEVTKFEEARAREKELDLFRSLGQGYLKAQRVTSEELLLTIKRQFYPGMPTPYLEVDYGNRIGMNDILIETGGVVSNDYRHIRFNQEIDGQVYEGYRATLSFARFPQVMTMPGPAVPFLYAPSSLGYPYTMSSRFTMIPHHEMKKELNKKQMEMKDETENLASSDQGIHQGVVNSMQDLSELEAELEDNKMPWLSGTYHITIESDSLEDLKTNIVEIKQEYAESETTLVWTAGDQMELFLEDIPGSSLKMTSFIQKTDLAMLGISGFNIGGAAGDPVFQRVVTNKKLI